MLVLSKNRSIALIAGVMWSSSRESAAKALLQYAETGMSDAAATDHIEKLYGALSAKVE